MNTFDWLTLIKNAEKSALVKDGKKKIHYKLESGEEMLEEYSLETNVLLRRAWRKKDLRDDKNWKVELGDAEPQLQNLDTIGIVESSNSPYITKRLTKTNIEWRIRNLPFEQSVYKVTADEEQNCLIVRTSNKKYYKKIEVEELKRVNLRPNQNSVSFCHKFNTLIISYKKPPEVLKLEEAVQEELKSVQTIKDSDMDCNPS